jgi:hypothetical protein
VRRYDATISAVPSTVDKFRTFGVPSYILRHAFHPRVASAVGEGGEPIPVSFVGSLSPLHTSRIALLEKVADRCDLRVWSGDAPKSPKLRERYVGPAWGRDMYAILARSRVTINNHLDGMRDADNCRLYEATGVGTLLVTDWKRNLHELFEPGQELLAYRTVEACADLVARYLDRHDDRTAIARAGQARTLKEHTYRQRMEELVEIVDRHRRLSALAV